MCEVNTEVHVAVKVETFEMSLISRMRRRSPSLLEVAFWQIVGLGKQA